MENLVKELKRVLDSYQTVVIDGLPEISLKRLWRTCLKKGDGLFEDVGVAIDGDPHMANLIATEFGSIFNEAFGFLLEKKTDLRQTIIICACEFFRLDILLNNQMRETMTPMYMAAIYISMFMATQSFDLFYASAGYNALQRRGGENMKLEESIVSDGLHDILFFFEPLLGLQLVLVDVVRKIYSNATPEQRLAFVVSIIEQNDDFSIIIDILSAMEGNPDAKTKLPRVLQCVVELSWENCILEALATTISSKHVAQYRIESQDTKRERDGLYTAFDEVLRVCCW